MIVFCGNWFWFLEVLYFLLYVFCVDVIIFGVCVDEFYYYMKMRCVSDMSDDVIFVFVDVENDVFIFNCISICIVCF